MTGTRPKEIGADLLLELASDLAAKLFKQFGFVAPTYIAVAADNELLIATPPPASSKDLSIAMVAALFEIRGVDRYAFFDEAWTVSLPKDEEPPAGGARAHPNRREVIVYTVEMLNGKTLLAEQPIRRRPGEQPELGPLEHMPSIPLGGRMVGLLKPRGSMH